MNLVFISAEVLLIALFIILLYQYQKNETRLLHVFILISILLISLTHIFAFNTDAEDTYIGLRYVKNLVDGNGFVFNSFDRVEGYSDFLWLLLIAGLHKVSGLDIPFAARTLGLICSVITLAYSYQLAHKLTGEKTPGYLVAFLIAMNGSFSCYGLSGLENPLFAFFILFFVDSLLAHRWYRVGIIIGLAAMTRPEGVVLSLPVGLYLLAYEATWKDRMLNLSKSGFAAFILFIPWTYWRYDYYGYLIPNTIAAKDGMDLWYQLKIGLKYSFRFLFDHMEWMLLIVIPAVMLMKELKHTKSLRSVSPSVFVCFTVAFTFLVVYTYFGGDWMPGFRFYASIIPLLGLLLLLVWKNSRIPFNQIGLYLVIALVGFSQLRNSTQSPYMIKGVREWDYEVNGLKMIGKWFQDTLPNTTLLATLPNGAFSYYNELPTIDAGGLTDNQVGRYGNKKKVGGVPGHIAENWSYVLSKQPAIIAVMGGRGFESEINNMPIEGYSNATFVFANYENPIGKYVNLYLRNDEREALINYLLKDNRVQLLK